MGLPVADYEAYLNEQVSYWAAKSPTPEESLAWVEAELVPLMPAA